jgi:PadR family transcriptional regulator PadR
LRISLGAQGILHHKVPCATLIEVNGFYGDSGRDWLSQARRGVIELCVLTLINKSPHYGYELATALSQWKPLAAPEGTLYPLLRRLQREGVIDASWQESRDGPPRKYYHLTPTGTRLLQAQLTEWEQLTQSVGFLRANILEPADGPPDEEVLNGSASKRLSAVSRRAAPSSRPPAAS